MTKTLRPAPSYIRFLNLLTAIRDIPPFSDMNADEERLLNALALIWFEPRGVTVADVMRNCEGVSHSTTYRRLLGLKEKGMVQFIDDVDDKRIKKVEPTALANDYIEKIGRCIDRAGIGAGQAI